MRLVLLGGGMLLLILVPFFLWEDAFTGFAAALIQEHKGAWWQAPAIAGLLASDIFLPIPSSILSTASGAVLGFLVGAVTNILGMSAGCWLGYAAGKPAGRKVLNESDHARVEKMWARYGDWTLILTRAVPVLAEAAVLFAGLIGMDRRRFFLLTTGANIGIGALYAAVGAFAMEWNSFLAAFGGSILIPALAMGVLRARKLS